MAARRALASASSALILAAAPAAPGLARSAGEGTVGQMPCTMPPEKALTGLIPLLMSCPRGVAHRAALQAALAARHLSTNVGAGTATGTPAGTAAGGAAAGNCAQPAGARLTRVANPVQYFCQVFMAPFPYFAK